MSETEFATVMFTGLCVLSLIGLIVLIRRVQIDSLREFLFGLRDEMFLYAFDEELIESTAYRNLRIMMNSLIRYAHRASFAHMIILMIAQRSFGIETVEPILLKEWSQAVDKLPSPQAEKLRDFHARARQALFRHMVFQSPLVWCLVIGIIVYALLVKGPQMTVKAAATAILKPRMHLDIVEADAVASAAC